MMIKMPYNLDLEERINHLIDQFGEKIR